MKRWMVDGDAKRVFPIHAAAKFSGSTWTFENFTPMMFLPQGKADCDCSSIAKNAKAQRPNREELTFFNAILFRSFVIRLLLCCHALGALVEMVLEGAAFGGTGTI